jgi:hypothetical protein
MDEEKAMSIGERMGGCAQFAAGVMPIAEKELAAFARAVTELFGAEQARRAVEDWIEELEFSDWPAGSALPHCRQVTIAAAARLANRVNSRFRTSDWKVARPLRRASSSLGGVRPAHRGNGAMR